MQTQQEIQALLSSRGVAPNKRFGQHFLVDLNLMRFLLRSACVTSRDVVLEVGCGTGSLTEGLAQNAGRVIAVELDTSLIPIAESRLADLPNVTLLNRDILAGKHRLDPVVVETITNAPRPVGGRFLLVANLPYHVASAVMVNLVTGPVVADAMFVTVQKEVGERMIAASGDGHYGCLSIMLQATGRLEKLRTMKPSVFWPRPQVDSAMLAFERDPRRIADIRDMALLREVLDLFMGHRRKMMKSAVRMARGRLADVGDWSDLFALCRIDAADRPERVTPAQYVALANAILT